ncbi:MAG: peptidoglycan DD-metalloendopeptidase family protein [Clostridium sp.]|jgi:murein DD-endopeptidase MepM/ murein hydrolase activator NlpD|nr:peptidoglycan DD-metalloendopeptidase family protein [Clostridium sp.]
MRKKKKATGICLAVSLSLLLSVLPVGTVYGITSASIQQKQNQISQAKTDKENLQNSLTDIQRIKGELEAQKRDLKSYVEALDGNLAAIEQNISDLKQQIGRKETEIAQAQQELEEALATEEKQYESMKNRIRFRYETGDTYMLGLLLRTQSFAEFLNKADFTEKVYAYDRRILEEYKMNRQYIELCREQLSLERELLDRQKAAVEEEQGKVESLIQQKNRQIREYESDIGNKEQAIREYEAEIAEQNELISTLEALIAEEKRRLLENSGSVIKYDGGIFRFPMATYTRISDEYGMRMHPTLGVEQFHNGVDFAAPAGTPIYAAYDGVVVASAYSATMGNYIMIDHGDSLYTIYMHASALYAAKDDVVVRGETIAAVGSTGRSTGNHLHFSVRLNGSYVSPWNYLSA